jgi:hypothetical protein
MLTALRVENAKPRGKPYKLSDGDRLHLLAQLYQLTAKSE